ncbi:hypothetical protein E5D57_009306 [Metarhizium anisopliae]|nr:hypothetical protein E5D57_009306 [Metarhizium anisopliae]
MFNADQLKYSRSKSVTQTLRGVAFTRTPHSEEVFLRGLDERTTYSSGDAIAANPTKFRAIPGTGSLTSLASDNPSDRLAV